MSDPIEIEIFDEKDLQKEYNKNPAVLDGELAVPCSPQSAIVGSNPLPRLVFFWSVSLQVVLKVWALCKERPVNPVRTGR